MIYPLPTPILVPSSHGGGAPATWPEVALALAVVFSLLTFALVAGTTVINWFMGDYPTLWASIKATGQFIARLAHAIY